MRENGRKREKKTGITLDPISCIRRHPVPALFATFLFGVGIGALIAETICHIREERAEEERKKGGGGVSLLLTLLTPYLLRRILRILTG
ncbi:hypothetical protein [Methanocalculus natronophilus]|uniref:hypothetical protein n=1 Tax=Methanocalculus natronophilus TaxID=1262400 RepID=UPI0031B609D4